MADVIVVTSKWPRPLWRKLRVVAAERDTTLSELIREGVIAHYAITPDRDTEE
jgi:hypothetical protein